MKRRGFINTIAATTPLAVFPKTQSLGDLFENKFNLNYAPHFGMFQNMEGKDLIDQLNFMADNGVKAFEDNGMKNRSISMQEKIGSTLNKRNMSMGVFVAHKIYWNEPNLASGNKNKREEFLKHITDFGAIGLESSFGALNSLLGLNKTIEIMNSSYEVFNLSRPTIKIGNEAKISMFDPTEKYIFSKKNIYSSSKNSSFLNTEITGISKGIISNYKVHIVE